MTTNKKQVHLKLITKIKQPTWQTTKLTTKAKLITKDQTSYLRYEECLKDNPKALVTFKIKKDQVQLTRQQDLVRSILVFDPKKTQQTFYQVGTSKIELEVKTLSLKIDLKDDTGQISIDYQLYNQAKLLGDYKIRLQFMV